MMDESSREKIFRMSADLVAETSMAFKRYLYSDLDFDHASFRQGHLEFIDEHGGTSTHGLEPFRQKAIKGVYVPKPLILFHVERDLRPLRTLREGVSVRLLSAGRGEGRRLPQSRPPPLPSLRRALSKAGAEHRKGNQRVEAY